eukprot:4877857-Amphidinium_carterae.1
MLRMVAGTSPDKEIARVTTYSGYRINIAFNTRSTVDWPPTAPDSEDRATMISRSPTRSPVWQMFRCWLSSFIGQKFEPLFRTWHTVGPMGTNA